MTMTQEEYVSKIQAIDTRISELTTLKTQAAATATTGTPDLMSERFLHDLARPYDSEIIYLQRRRDTVSIEFAETFLV
jgi:hypothetical protein